MVCRADVVGVVPKATVSGAVIPTFAAAVIWAPMVAPTVAVSETE